jgi:hypothetical protein
MIDSMRVQAECQVRQGIAESLAVLQLIAELDRLRVVNAALDEQIRTMEWYREESK